MGNQGFRAAGIQGFRDLRTQGIMVVWIWGFRDLRTQGFKELGNWELSELEIKRYSMELGIFGFRHQGIKRFLIRGIK